MSEEFVRGDCRVLHARVELVETLREDFSIFLSDLGLDKKDIDFWQLMLSESVVNAMLHGCQGDVEATVRVRWTCCGEEIRLEVQDPGPGPADSVINEPSLPTDPYQSHGRGIYLLQSYADRLEHWKSAAGYLQRIVKRHEGMSKDQERDTVLEQTLNELSVSYESLAAFYRLGDGLVRAESVTHFISQAVEDLRKVVRCHDLTLYLSDKLQEALHGELATLPFIRSWSGLGGLQQEVVATRVEQIWESYTEVEHDALLKPYACGICYPVMAGGKQYGVITVVRRELPYYIAGELNTVRTFADLFGIAIANADNTIVRTHEQRAFQELAIATEIQKTLLPLPDVTCPPEWNLFTARRSARDVAGDYLEVHRHRSGDTLFAVVDVMGKGVSAAFLAAMFRTAFNVLVGTDTDLLGLAHSLNQVLCSHIGDMTLFATCALVSIPPSLDRVTVINAGHCPVILSNEDGTLREAEPSGPPFGLFPDAVYECETLPVTPQDKLLLFTDGLYEWETKDGFWGWEAFLDFLRQEAASSPADIWKKLLRKMERECQDFADTHDDLTLLVWGANPPPEK